MLRIVLDTKIDGSLLLKGSGGLDMGEKVESHVRKIKLLCWHENLHRLGGKEPLSPPCKWSSSETVFPK